MGLWQGYAKEVRRASAVQQKRAWVVVVVAEAKWDLLKLAIWEAD